MGKLVAYSRTNELSQTLPYMQHLLMSSRRWATYDVAKESRVLPHSQGLNDLALLKLLSQIQRQKLLG